MAVVSIAFRYNAGAALPRPMLLYVLVKLLNNSLPPEIEYRYRIYYGGSLN